MTMNVASRTAGAGAGADSLAGAGGTADAARPGSSASRPRWALALVLVAAGCGGQAPADGPSVPAAVQPLPGPRVLALTDLPPLVGTPSPEDFVDAQQLATSAGCRGAVLTYSWPSLESRPGSLRHDELEQALDFQGDRVLYLGLQVLNTTVAELPDDLVGLPFDAPLVLERIEGFLEDAAPHLARVRYLSIGNEVDVHLALNPDRRAAWLRFLAHAANCARRVAPGIVVGTTVTEAGVAEAGYAELVDGLDAHFVTFYHGRSGVDGVFEDAERAAERIRDLVVRLDDGRPVVFQELGYPSHPTLASEGEQARFVASAFEGLDAVRARVPFVNWFMLYDFPPGFVAEQIEYYGLEPDAADDLAAFLGSLGLRRSDGSAKPGWRAFRDHAPRWLDPEPDPAPEEERR